MITPEKTKFGFNVNFNCDTCHEEIFIEFKWFGFGLLSSKGGTRWIKCPICLAEHEINLSSIDRSQMNSSYVISNWSSSREGIEGMEIGKTFVIK